MIAIFAGTFVELISKYLLDKCWIFYYSTIVPYNNGKKFGLYSLMGIVMTLVFLIFMIVFWLIWSSNIMREIGVILGLIIGYAIKFQLDSKFVFSKTLRDAVI